MVQLIPGHLTLGMGFDPFGRYDESSVKGMRRLFDSALPGTETYKGFSVPKNVSVQPTELREAETYVFESREELEDYFKAEAGAKGSFLSFSASLSASFESISKTTSEYTYGMAAAYSDGYEVSLLQAAPSDLSEEFITDPDYKNLPSTYGPETRSLFFQFFEKYGISFVSSVRMGGRIFYEFWIEKSYQMTKEAITASLAAEYAAVFKLNASIQWNQLDSRWRTGRRTHITAIGGDDQVLNGLLPSPSKTDSFASQYTSWVNSIGQNPAPVSFSLTGIETLFSGAQYEAVKAAAQDYASHTISVQVGPGPATISSNGLPTFDPVSAYGGLSYAVFDSSTGVPLIAESLYFKTEKEQYWDQYPPGKTPAVMPRASLGLKPYADDPSVIIAILFWGAIQSTGSLLYYPDKDFHDFIIGLGAGDGFAKWMDVQGQVSGDYGTKGGLSGQYNQAKASYAIVGKPRSIPGSAFEDYNSVMMYPHRLETPSIDLLVNLRPISTSNGYIYSLA